MDKRFYIGVFAALFAAFAFSLNFIVPFIIGDYSIFDFALIRHVVAAVIGLYILFSKKEVMQYLTLRNWLATMGLAFIGYVGYFLMVTGALFSAGLSSPQPFSAWSRSCWRSSATGVRDQCRGAC